MEPKKIELRQDFLTEQWVSVAAVRGNRPMHFNQMQLLSDKDSYSCPFCPENRHLTRGDTAKIGDVRAVPNIYPMLEVSSEEGYGYHEVIIDSSHHDKSLKDFTPEHIVDIFLVLQNREKAFLRDPKIKCVQIYKNHKSEAGASIYHAHWQVVAMPFVPPKKVIMLRNFAKYQKETGTCYMCEEVAKARDCGRVILEGDTAVAYVPYAAMYAYTVWVTPTRHVQSFNQLCLKELTDVAVLLKETVTALSKVYEGISYNICFHCAPIDTVEKVGFEGEGKDLKKKKDKNDDIDKSWDKWHCYFEIIPRVAGIAGHELSTGCFINSVEPETAAVVLHKLIEEGNND